MAKTNGSQNAASTATGRSTKSRFKRSTKKASSTRRFEHVGGKSSKFWEIQCRGRTHQVRFGRIGSHGQTRDKSFLTADEARADTEKLIAQKLAKGYKPVAVNNPNASHGPLLPKLKWDEFEWKGNIVLPSWRDYQTRLAPYTRVSSPRKSAGRVPLRVFTPLEQQVEPSLAQRRAYQYLLENEQAIHKAVAKEVMKQYSLIRSEYASHSYPPPDWFQRLPAVMTNAVELESNVGLAHVYLLVAAKSNLAYVGFGFGCDWEEEHGVGVLTHRRRVVDVGGQDVAFLSPSE